MLARPVNTVLTGADLASAGALNLIAVNASPGGGTSAAASLPVNNPVPTIAASVAAGTPSSSPITITGTNFVAGSCVLVGTTAHAATAVSATQITSALSAADVASAGSRMVALTGHYYAEGPPNDPRVTTARLLAGNPKVTASTEAIVRVAEAHGLTYYMTEGNSCYRGSKPGMSDAFASALWAGDYIFQLASLGCAGVNLHGGDSRFLSVGLGDHDPGLQVASGHPAAPNGSTSSGLTSPGMQTVAVGLTVWDTASR